MKNVSKRLLAVVLALVLCLSLLPGIALAADSFVKVTGLSDVTSGGKFVLVANNLAMGTTLSSKYKFDGVAVSPTGNTLTGTQPAWTFEAVEGGIAISVDGQYLAYDSGTNFKMQADAYVWTVTAGANGFVIKSAATTRAIAMQTQYSRFGPYATSNMGKTEYVFELDLYKDASGGGICEHTYDTVVVTAVTCAKDGKETCTCSKCGDTFDKVIEALGHDYVAGTCMKCDGVIGTDPAKVIPEAYALATGDIMPNDAMLTGKVISVDTEYSEQYGNITVTIAVEGYEEYPIQCYRLKGNGIDTLKVGDVITVLGTIKNYKGKIEFDLGCKIPVLAPEDPKQIVDEAYALEESAELPYEAILTGKILSVDDPYSEQFKNITVTMAIEGREDKPIKCYRMKGEGVENLKVGDTITVAGTIKNFYGTVEYNLPYLIPTPTSEGVTVSGAVATGAAGDTTLELIADGEVVATATASGKTANYTLENVAAGTYTLKVSKQNHVTREYTVTVGTEALVQDVKIHLIGDVDGNGTVNMGDALSTYAHVRGTQKFTDEYQIQVADVIRGGLNMGDALAIYAHIKGTQKLY